MHARITVARMARRIMHGQAAPFIIHTQGISQNERDWQGKDGHSAVIWQLASHGRH